MIHDDSGGNEEERDQNETPKSPTANASQQETKVGLSSYLVFHICIQLFVVVFFTLHHSFSVEPDYNTAHCQTIKSLNYVNNSGNK